ncbi:hypothetical protein [Agreia sp. VKM Ac-1783]|uniref:peptidoglycan-binding domain-containing protein n=1 Tax=Agreia sp. VKM Ac-1783 TaxID=1938889 RepID=UPI000A2AA787|nr:hypothetical protein [Agreia sp. VKM Ac-1783]SMQ71904.1 hypothetical protein SAMN06295943_2789 [Agreia sp. VKM Ac-1783]
MVLVAAAGLTAGLLISQPPAIPPSLTIDKNSADVIPLTSESLSDSRDVQLTVKIGKKRQLSSPVAGLLTRMDCEVGTQFVSWQTNLAVSGSPLLNLYTSTPLWRDLRDGDKGEDVKSIQTELVRLGYEVATDGIMGPRTLSILQSRLKEIGSPVADPAVFTKASVVWLPAPTAVASSCDVPLGATVSEGQAGVSLEADVQGVTVKSAPTDLVPGPRLLLVDGSSFAVDDKSELISPEDLALFATLPSYRASVASGTTPQKGEDSDQTDGGSGSLDGGGLSAVLELATPLNVSIMPPSALASQNGPTACVVADKTPLQVTVVASSLGKAYVTFANDVTPPAAVDLHPAKDTKC